MGTPQPADRDEVIASLPDELRIPIILHYLNGLSQEEIAAEMNVTQSSISRHLIRGLQVLRARMGELGLSISVTVLVTLIKENAVQAAPASLTALLGKIALAGIRPASVGPAMYLRASLASLPSFAKLLLVLVGVVTVGFTGWYTIESFTARRSPYDQIVAANAPFLDIDVPLELPLKIRTLADSLDTFHYGTPERFDDWLRVRLDGSPLLAGPLVQSHGDPRIERVGTYAADVRPGQLAYGLLDFERSATEPYVFDLLRAQLSLMLVARRNDVRANDSNWRTVAGAIVGGYHTALSDPSRLRLQIATSPQAVMLIERAKRRPYEDELDRYVVGERFLPCAFDGDGKIKDVMCPSDLSREWLARGIAQAIHQSAALRAVFRSAEATEIRDQILAVVERVNLEATNSQGRRKLFVLLRSPLVGLPHDAILYLEQQVKREERSGDPAQLVFDATVRGSGVAPLIGWCRIGSDSFTLTLKEPWSRELDSRRFRSEADLIEAAELMGQLLGLVHATSPNGSQISPPDDLTALLATIAAEYFDELRQDYKAFAKDHRVGNDVGSANARLEELINRRNQPSDER